MVVISCRAVGQEKKQGDTAEAEKKVRTMLFAGPVAVLAVVLPATSPPGASPSSSMGSSMPGARKPGTDGEDNACMRLVDLVAGRNSRERLLIQRYDRHTIYLVGFFAINWLSSHALVYPPNLLLMLAGMIADLPMRATIQLRKRVRPQASAGLPPSVITSSQDAISKISLRSD